jgi:hypothetical protein
MDALAFNPVTQKWDLVNSITDLKNIFIPYIGATADVNLGSKNFQTTGTITSGAITATSVKAPLYLGVRNETAATIVTTKAVYMSGFNNLPLVALADNTNELKHNILGVTVGSIADSTNGVIATSGQFDAETNSYTAVGVELYLGTNGTLVEGQPTSGDVQHIGIVTVKESYPVGKILIYRNPEPNIVSAPSAIDNIVRMGDNLGVKKTSFRDYANNEVASINSDGKLSLVDTNTYINRDGSNNMTFTDAIVGTRTLKQLGCPTMKTLYSAGQVAGNLNLTDVNWAVSKAWLKRLTLAITAGSSSDYTVQIYEKDTFLAANLIFTQQYNTGDIDIILDYLFQDQDSTNELHIKVTDNDGTNPITFTISLRGIELL